MLRKAVKPKGIKVKKVKKEIKTKKPIYDVHLRDRNRELDVENLNDDFFQNATKIIQEYFENDEHRVAMDIKYYFDVLKKVYGKYCQKRDEVDQLIPKAKKGEEQLKCALELNANSEECMKKMKESLAEAWTEIDEAHEREQNIQAQLQDLLLQCETLEIRKQSLQIQGQELGSLGKYRNIILRERDRMAGEVMELEKRLQTLRYYTEIVEYINTTQEKYIHKLEGNIRQVEGERDLLNSKIRNQHGVIDELKIINMKGSVKLDQITKDFIDIQNKLAQKKKDCDRIHRSLDKLQNIKGILKRQILDNEEEIKSLKGEQLNNDRLIKTLRLEDKIKTNTISQLQKNYKKVVQNYNIASTRLYQVNKLNMQHTDENTRLKNMSNALEREIINAANKYEDLRILKDNIYRERETLRSAITKCNNTIADLRHTIMMNGITIDGLRLDINKLHVKLDESRFFIAKVEKERDEMAQDIQTLNERIEGYQDSINIKNEQIANMSEEIEKFKFNLINLKKQLDASNTEIIILKRSLDTCRQERDDIRNLNTKNTHQIAQATAEINANLVTIGGLKVEIERITNEKKELLTNLKNTETLLANTRTDLKDMRKKNDHLMKIISEDELKMMKITQDLDETRKERSLIGLQMVRRNDEIVVLKEKLHIMQNSLDNGTSQYNQRIEDIRLLKIEISNLSTDRECLRRALSSTANMREEIIRLQRQLNQERIRIRSLTEDMKTPVGIHRWRLLKGEDPKRYELMRKLQLLQKRNIKGSIRYTNLQNKLNESEKTITVLKHIVDNLPKDDVKEKLVKCQRKNRKQERTLKLLSAELRIQQIEAEHRNCSGDSKDVSKTQPSFKFPNSTKETVQNEEDSERNTICGKSNLQEFFIQS